MRAQWILGSLVLVLAMTACQMQQKPTEVKETSERNAIESIYAIESPLEITESTVVLDARSLFEYASGHIPGSFNLQWQDFSQKTPGFQGLLQKDLDALANRLALIGIARQTPVIVVGRGSAGKGEEGRIAWMLSYLGVEDVNAVPLSYFDSNLTTKETETPKNAQPWRADPKEELLVEREEMMAAIAKPETKDVVILDVRTADEYLKSSSAAGYPDIGAMNVPWTQVFSGTGRPEVSLVQRLQGVGVDRGDRILVISDQGVRSAAVTKALQELGFPRTGNFAGGYKALMVRK